MIFARRKLLACSTAFTLAAALAMGFGSTARSAPPENAWAIISSDPQFSDVTALFKYAGLVQYVQADHFTAFIPTNAAFAKDPNVLPSLMTGHGKAFPDTTLAVNFIRSHAIPGLHPLSEFSGRTDTLTAFSGMPIIIDGLRPGVYTVHWSSVQSEIATARVVDTPIVASNALIYPVDTVVLTDLQSP